MAIELGHIRPGMFEQAALQQNAEGAVALTSLLCSLGSTRANASSIDSFIHFIQEPFNTPESQAVLYAKARGQDGGALLLPEGMKPLLVMHSFQAFEIERAKTAYRDPKTFKRFDDILHELTWALGLCRYPSTYFLREELVQGSHHFMQFELIPGYNVGVEMREQKMADDIGYKASYRFYLEADPYTPESELPGAEYYDKVLIPEILSGNLYRIASATRYGELITSALISSLLGNEDDKTEIVRISLRPNGSNEVLIKDPDDPTSEGFRLMQSFNTTNLNGRSTHPRHWRDALAIAECCDSYAGNNNTWSEVLDDKIHIHYRHGAVSEVITTVAFTRIRHGENPTEDTVVMSIIHPRDHLLEILNDGRNRLIRNMNDIRKELRELNSYNQLLSWAGISIPNAQVARVSTVNVPINLDTSDTEDLIDEISDLIDPQEIVLQVDVERPALGLGMVPVAVYKSLIDKINTEVTFQWPTHAGVGWGRYIEELLAYNLIDAQVAGYLKELRVHRNFPERKPLHVKLGWEYPLAFPTDLGVLEHLLENSEAKATVEVADLYENLIGIQSKLFHAARNSSDERNVFFLTDAIQKGWITDFHNLDRVVRRLLSKIEKDN
jgi:hypothetical protein